MSIQIYGQFSNYLSMATVSRAIANELHKKRFDVTVFDVNALYPQYLDTYPDVGFRMAAHVGIYVGYPESAAGFLSGHAFKVLVTVCETNKIPNSWVDACNVVDLVCVPSQWCYDAFVNSGVTKPVIIVRHGIYADLAREIRNELEGPKPNAILHVSGSLSFAARKGTSKLLRSYKKLIDSNNFKESAPLLLLKMPKTEGVMKVLEHLELSKRVDFIKDDSFSPERMYRVLNRVGAVFQPSRAEGFGLVPLEARSVGTSVFMTNCTGHSEHYSEEYDYAISTGSLELLETQANPVGFAPTLDEEKVYNALHDFRIDPNLWCENRKWADEHADEWDWSRVLTPLVKELKSLDIPKSRIKLGMGAGLRGME